MIQNQVTNNTWSPIKISRHGLNFSHLLFVDDCLLFTEAKSSQVKLVRDVLQKICFASGLKINIQKSKFMSSSNVSRPKQHKFESLLQFNHTSHLGKYLGFPMLLGRIKNFDFNFILDKINGRLAGWKMNLLSRSGRITLAKSVVTAMPIYTMQNHWLPFGICENIDAIFRSFIWGRNYCHWVNWKNLTMPKSRGGLGIRTAKNLNISLLGKHIWDILHQPQKLWVQMLRHKYLSNTHIMHTPFKLGSFCIWRAIVKAVEILGQGFICRIGRGHVSIWYDK